MEIVTIDGHIIRDVSEEFVERLLFGKAMPKTMNVWKVEKPKKRRKRVFWTKREDSFVRRNYGKKPIPRIAEKLGRTEFAVKNRVVTLGIKKKRK